MHNTARVAALAALVLLLLIPSVRARQSALPPGAGEQPGNVIDLGSLGGSSSATDVNTWGTITGTSEIAPEGPRRAFVTTPHGTMHALTVSGDGESFGQGINDFAEVGGIVDTLDGRHGFVHNGATAIDLGPGWPQAINNDRDVAGAQWPEPTLATPIPVLWRRAAAPLALAPAGKRGEALDVNDRAEAVGWMADVNAVTHAVIWEPDGRIVDLGFGSGGIASTATAINDVGDVAGFRYTADMKVHAFVWRRGTGMTDLFGADVESQALDLNDAGQVVGALLERASGSYSRVTPFVWSEDVGLIPLTNPISNVGRAVAINDLGEIVGYANEPQEEGPSHALWWYQPPLMAAEFTAIERLIATLQSDRQLNHGHATALSAQLRTAERAWRRGSRGSRLLDALSERAARFVADPRRAARLHALLQRLALRSAE